MQKCNELNADISEWWLQVGGLIEIRRDRHPTFKETLVSILGLNTEIKLTGEDGLPEGQSLFLHECKRTRKYVLALSNPRIPLGRYSLCWQTNYTRRMYG